MSGRHKMVPGGFGHAVSHCAYCMATEREIAYALGPVCPSSPATGGELAAVLGGRQMTADDIGIGATAILDNLPLKATSDPVTEAQIRALPPEGGAS